MTEITFVFTADGYVTHADGTTDRDEAEPQDSEPQDDEDN